MGRSMSALNPNYKEELLIFRNSPRKSSKQKVRIISELVKSTII